MWVCENILKMKSGALMYRETDVAIKYSSRGFLHSCTLVFRLLSQRFDTSSRLSQLSIFKTQLRFQGEIWNAALFKKQKQQCSNNLQDLHKKQALWMLNQKKTMHLFWFILYTPCLSNHTNHKPLQTPSIKWKMLWAWPPLPLIQIIFPLITGTFDHIFALGLYCIMTST